MINPGRYAVSVYSGDYSKAAKQSVKMLKTEIDPTIEVFEDWDHLPLEGDLICFYWDNSLKRFDKIFEQNGHSYLGPRGGPVQPCFPIEDFVLAKKSDVRWQKIVSWLWEDGWTPEKQVALIDALAASGCVADACRSVGMSTESAYALRGRDDAAEFVAAWDAALDFAVRRLSDSALSRAINGVPVPHYHKGAIVGEHRRYHEGLTMFILRARDPDRYGGAAGRGASRPSIGESRPRRWIAADRDTAPELPDEHDDIFDEALATLPPDQLRELFAVQGVDGVDAAFEAALEMLDDHDAASGDDADGDEVPAGAEAAPLCADIGVAQRNDTRVAARDAEAATTTARDDDRRDTLSTSSTSSPPLVVVRPDPGRSGGRIEQTWLTSTPPPSDIDGWRPPYWAQRIN